MISALFFRLHIAGVYVFNFIYFILIYFILFYFVSAVLAERNIAAMPVIDDAGKVIGEKWEEKILIEKT